MRGPDFFDTKQYPDITFASKSVKKTGDKTYEVTGELTLHGTTKSVTVTFTKTGDGQNVKGMPMVGYETTLTLRRSDYGVSGYVGKGVGDEVTWPIRIDRLLVFDEMGSRL